MKTAKQWSDEIRKMQTRVPVAQIVAQIQADALRHAAGIAHDLNEHINANEGWHIIQALEGEADKLEGK